MNEKELVLEITQLAAGKCTSAQVKEVIRCLKIVMAKDCKAVMRMGPDENKHLCFPMYSIVTKLYQSGSEGTK